MNLTSLRRSLIHPTAQSLNSILTTRKQCLSTLSTTHSRGRFSSKHHSTPPFIAKSPYSRPLSSTSIRPYSRQFTTLKSPLPLSKQPQPRTVPSPTTPLARRTTYRTSSYASRSRHFSTTSESAPTPLLPPPTLAQKARMTAGTTDLYTFGSKESWQKFTSGAWKWLKRVVLAYLGVNILSAAVIAYFAPFVRQMVLNRSVADLTVWGAKSQWYFPLFRQDSEYALTFDPKLPALNFYRLKIFILKELEATYRAGTGILDFGETLRQNAQLRITMLQNVIARGWALGSELSTIIYGSSAVTRREQSGSALDGHWVLEPKTGPTEYGVSDTVELNRAQLEYIKEALRELQQLEELGIKLYGLGNELKSSSITSMWKLGFNNSDLRFNFETEKPSAKFHQMASVAAATGKLSDAVYTLTSANTEQIISFLKYFDTKVAELANYGPRDDPPKFPKLSFEVPNEAHFASQLAVLQDKLRKIHDPDYDPNNPELVLDELGTPLNPSQLHQNRPYIPYVSPARPYPLIASKPIKMLEQSICIDPTFQDEVDAAVVLKSIKFYDTWREFYSDLSDSLLKYRHDAIVKDQQDENLRQQVQDAQKQSQELSKLGKPPKQAP